MLFKLNPTEKILLEVRRHRFVFYQSVVRLVFLFSLTLLGSIFLLAFLAEGNPLRDIAIIGLLFISLFLWEYAFIVWLDYHLDVWVVTTERIVDIEVPGLFKINVSEFKLSNVQDVSVDVHGIVPTFFNFGNVHIQTAGALRQFVFEQVPHPHEIRKKILDAYDAHTKDLRLHPHIHQGETT